MFVKSVPNPAWLFLGNVVSHMGQLHQYDVISSASASTIVCMMVDSCYFHGLVIHDSPVRFRRFVREPLERIFSSLFESIWDVLTSVTKDGPMRRLTTMLFATHQRVPKSVRQSRRLKHPTFCYEHFDMKRAKVSHIHSDIKASDPFRRLKIILRCCTPLSRMSGSDACADAGISTGVTGGIGVIETYNTKHLTLISVNDIYYYTPEESGTLFYWAIRTLPFFKIRTSTMLTTMLCDPDLTPHSLTICGISSDVEPSKDIFHRGLFSDYHTVTLLGVPWWSYSLPHAAQQIFQNEGYLQMHASAGKCKGGCVVKVPHPQVYNTNVRRVLIQAGYKDNSDL